MSFLKCIRIELRKKWKRGLSGLLAAVMALSLIAIAPEQTHASTISSVSLGQTVNKWMIDESSGYIYATTSDSMKLLFISLADLQVKKEISYLSSPTDLVEDSGKLYVPLSGTSQISVVDVVNQSVTSNVYTSNGDPYQIAVDGNNLYYVMQNNHSFVTFKDLTTGTETQIGAPYTADSIYKPALALDKSTHMLYAAESGISGGDVIAYDTQTNTIVASNESTYNEGYGFPYPQRTVIVEGDDVYYAGRRINKNNLALIKGDYNPELSGQTDVYYVNGSHVFTDSAVFDRDTYVKTAQLPYTTPLSLMDASGNVYLFNPTTKSIDKMTLSFSPTNIVTGTLSDNKLSINATVTKMVYSNQTGYLYAIVPTLNKLLTIDPAQPAIVRQTDVGSKPTDLTIADGKLYMSLYGATGIAVTDDVYGGAAVTTLDTAQNPRRLAVADGSIFYLPEFPGFSGSRSVYVMPSSGGTSQEVEYVSAYNYYYQANLLADAANHTLYIGETNSSPKNLYKMNTVPSAGKYADPLESAALGGTGETIIQDGTELFYGDSRFDTSSLAKLNGSSLYSSGVIAAKGNHVITETAVHDRNSVGKLFDLPYKAEAGVILDDGSVVLYSSSKGGLFRYSSVDEIKIPRELATNVTFTDNDANTGSIKGTISWTNPADTSYLSGFRLYFLDAQDQPISLIGTVTKPTNWYTINTMPVPAGAARIGVFSYNQWAESVKCASTQIWDFSSFLPPDIAFMDTNPAKGQIHGLLAWSPAADESSFSKYAVYFVNNNGQKIGTEPYALVPVGQASYLLDIPESAIPANASTIKIYSVTNSGEMPTWYAFARISDNIVSETPGVTSVTYGTTGMPTNPFYQDLNDNAGIINGQLSWTGVSSDTLGGTYKVYFLDASYKTVGSVAEVPVDALKCYEVTLTSQTILPAGAVFFGIVKKSSSGVEDPKALIIPINDLGGEASPNPAPAQTSTSTSTTESSNPAPGSTGSTNTGAGDSSVNTGAEGKVTIIYTETKLKDMLTDPSFTGSGSIKLEISGQGSIMQSILAGPAFEQIITANSQAALETSTPIGSVKILASEVLKGIQQSGQDLSNVNVTVSVSKVDSQVQNQWDKLSTGMQFTQVSVPVDFRITATVTTSNQQYEISTTTTYVAHTIPLTVSAGSQSTSTLAGVMYDPVANTFYPVPTVFTTGPDGSLQASLYRTGNSIYAVVSNQKTFTDVPSGHYAKDAIETLANKFVISGYDDNTFKSDKAVTRAEFASLLIRAMGIVPAKASKSNYQDVREGDWYYDAVSAAADNGLISGYEDGTFRPNQTITRQEMAKMIYTALRKGGYSKEIDSAQQETALSHFSDYSAIPDWAKEAASYAGSTGIMNGTANESFAGDATTDRAQSAVVLYRMMKTLNFIN